MDPLLFWISALFDGLGSSHWPILKENLIFVYEIVGSLFKEC